MHNLRNLDAQAEKFLPGLFLRASVNRPIGTISHQAQQGRHWKASCTSEKALYAWFARRTLCSLQALSEPPKRKAWGNPR